ncbi:hypothetical protein GC425_08440 [Corynebacterium sp. zg254]|nr:hypothetical protein [Corynebacterium sp. zg254]MCR5914878.1 hypothetical protein [Corynebacterium sp. zg254]
MVITHAHTIKDNSWRIAAAARELRAAPTGRVAVFGEAGRRLSTFMAASGTIFSGQAEGLGVTSDSILQFARDVQEHDAQALCQGGTP